MPAFKERYGCGWDERYRGKARPRPAIAKEYLQPGEPLPEEFRTCPQYYLHDPDVLQIFAELEDYTRGALGPVGMIPGHLVDYYRSADFGRREWQHRFQWGPEDDH